MYNLRLVLSVLLAQLRFVKKGFKPVLRSEELI